MLHSHIMHLIHYILIIYVYFMLKVWLFMVTSSVFSTSNKNINLQHSIQKGNTCSMIDATNKYIWYRTTRLSCADKHFLSNITAFLDIFCKFATFELSIFILLQFKHTSRPIISKYN